YLFAGWYLLSMEVKNSQKILPFIVSYLIAQTYIAIVFGIRDYPLKEVFAITTAASILLAIIILYVNEKKLESNYAVKSYINRLWLCLMFVGSYAWI
uniref:hypothetical protein n=1 Tax=Labilibaculum sp. TaxID=2060723 RepID=UPI003567C8A7